MNLTISEVEARWIRCPIPEERQHVSDFGRIETFDMALVCIRSEDGLEGFGEATILTGYTAETIDDSWAVACALAQRITGLEAGDAVPVIRAEHAATPFTSTAVMTALEMLDGHPLLGVPAATAVALLAIVNATGEDAIPHEIDARLRQREAVAIARSGRRLSRRHLLGIQ